MPRQPIILTAIDPPVLSVEDVARLFGVPVETLQKMESVPPFYSIAEAADEYILKLISISMQNPTHKKEHIHEEGAVTAGYHDEGGEAVVKKEDLLRQRVKKGAQVRLHPWLESAMSRGRYYRVDEVVEGVVSCYWQGKLYRFQIEDIIFISE